MLSFPSVIRIFLCHGPTDMRKGFDTLAALVREVLAQDPLSGHLFVFRNRRGDRVKLLYWDRDGFALWYKRLEQGTFRMPLGPEAHGEIDRRELAMMLEGMDLRELRRRKRFHYKKTSKIGLSSGT
jgi:transposase